MVKRSQVYVARLSTAVSGDHRGVTGQTSPERGEHHAQVMEQRSLPVGEVEIAAVRELRGVRLDPFRAALRVRLVVLEGLPPADPDERLIRHHRYRRLPTCVPP